MADVQILIQEIKVDGGVIDLGHLLTSAYIEKADIWSPLLILTFNDVDSIVRDEYHIRKDSVLKVKIADPLADDEAYFLESFTVLSTLLKGAVLTINCVQSDIHKLIFPIGQARIFRNQTGVAIIKKLIGGKSIRYLSGSAAALETYHLLPNSKPANLIRRIAKETGNLAFYSRGEFTFKSYDELMSEASTTYYWNDSRQKHQIVEYRALQDNWKRERKSFKAFDVDKGIIQTGDDGPAEWLGVAKQNTLESMNKIPIPAIILTSSGNALLRPGKPINHVWNKFRSESEVDESLPRQSLIHSITHFSEANSYQNKIMTVTL